MSRSRRRRRRQRRNQARRQEAREQARDDASASSLERRARETPVVSQPDLAVVLGYPIVLAPPLLVLGGLGGAPQALGAFLLVAPLCYLGARYLWDTEHDEPLRSFASSLTTTLWLGFLWLQVLLWGSAVLGAAHELGAGTPLGNVARLLGPVLGMVYISLGRERIEEGLLPLARRLLDGWHRLRLALDQAPEDEIRLLEAEAPPALSAPGEAPNLPLEPVAPSESPRCPCCDIPLEAGVTVRCASCGTPHHQDCWEFLGACSTYACGEESWT